MSLSSSPKKAEVGNPNVILQLVNYFKDSIVRTANGTKQLWSNHGRCREIRAKQQDYRDRLKKQWEFEEKDLSAKEMKERLAKIHGGITYDEFIFLLNGREDRGKLMNLAFLMWGAPKFFPYALMLYPDILPSPLAPLPDMSSTKETKLQKLARERSHAVLRTLMAIENEAKMVPALSKLNVFGKQGQIRRMDEMDSLGKTIGQIMTTSTTTTTTVDHPSVPGTTVIATSRGSIVMNTMENLLYQEGKDFTRAEKRLVHVPKSITTGILAAVNGPNLFQNIMPHFLKRGQVLNHIQKISEVDNFLVQEKINLMDLSTARLLEACSDRMIGGPNRTDQELRQGLADWLDLAVYQPTRRMKQTGEYFNENLARMALLSFYCVGGARDVRSTSYLPRVMYQGLQQQRRINDKDEGTTTAATNKKNRK
jgi:hypothetical protein